MVFEVITGILLVGFIGWFALKDRRGEIAYIFAAFAGIGGVFYTINSGFTSDVVLGWLVTSALLVAGYVADHLPRQS